MIKQSITIKQPLGLLEVGAPLIQAAEHLGKIAPGHGGGKSDVQARNLVQAVLPFLNVQTKKRVTHQVFCELDFTPEDERLKSRRGLERLLGRCFEFTSVTNTSDYGSRA